MNYPSGEFASAAQEAVRNVYTRQELQQYRTESLTPDPIMSGTPVAIAGRFAVDGSGTYLGFINNDPELAKQFPPEDIEACARSGQGLLSKIEGPFSVDSEEAESFVSTGLISSHSNRRLKLLAGIQISHSSVTEDLIPTLIYSRDLGSFIFHKREEIAGSLIIERETFDDLIERASPEEAVRFGLISNPDRSLIECTGAKVAGALLEGEDVTYL